MMLLVFSIVHNDLNLFKAKRQNTGTQILQYVFVSLLAADKVLAIALSDKLLGLDFDLDLTKEDDKTAVLKAVRDKYNEIKPDPVTLFDLKEALKSAQADLLKQAVNDVGATKDEKDKAIKAILKNIGVTEKCLNTELGKLKTATSAMGSSISSHQVKAAIDDIENRGLKNALAVDDVPTMLKVQ